MAYEATSQSIFQPYLKNMWHKGRIVDLTMRDKPFYAMIPKSEDFFGEDQKVNVKTRNPVGRSANSQKAQSNARSGRGHRFTVTRRSNHQSVFIQNETIESSQNDTGALLRVVDEQMSGAVENLQAEIAWGLYRSGGGTRGQIAAITATTITLSNVADARAFEVGMTLKGGTTDGTTATTFRSTPSTAEITGINRSTGVLTFGAGTFTGTNWAVNDYLSIDGDIDESTFIGKYIQGLEAWIPLTEPGGSDSFNGVNRSVDVNRLAGVRYDGRSKSVENALAYAAAAARDNGGKPDICLVSSTVYTNIVVSMGTRAVYQMMPGGGDAAKITFSGIVIPTDAGNIPVVSDPYCPDNVAWMLEKNSWKWHTLGPAPKPNLHAAGNMLDPQTATDDVEMRWVYRGNLECNAPGHNVRIRLG